MIDAEKLDLGDLLSPGGRTDEVVRRIVGLIYDGHLSPGDRFPSERLLAANLGVSRPVVREALNRLESRGYIKIRPKSGAYLRSTVPAPFRHQMEELALSEARWFQDLVDLRKALESYAIPRIIEQQQPEQLEKLKKCLEIMQRNSSLDRESRFKKYSQADLEFHRVLAKMTGNVVYLHLMDFLADLVLKSIRYSARVVESDYGKRNLEVHWAVVRALLEKDVAKALKAIHNHYEFVERFVEPILASERPRRIA